MSKTLLVSNAEAERLLKMGDCIAAMDEVLRDVSAGAITMLQRSMIHHKNGNILAGMPSTIDTKEKMCIRDRCRGHPGGNRALQWRKNPLVPRRTGGLR